MSLDMFCGNVLSAFFKSRLVAKGGLFMRWCPIPGAVAVIAATFCSLTSLSCQKKEPLKIGWLSSLTGPLSTAAIAENRGVEFAVEEINNAGGVNGQKIEIVTRDTAGDPTKAGNLWEKLIFVSKINAIISPPDTCAAPPFGAVVTT